MIHNIAHPYSKCIPTRIKLYPANCTLKIKRKQNQNKQLNIMENMYQKLKYFSKLCHILGMYYVNL